MTENKYIKALENSGLLSEPAIKKAINTLQLTPKSKILDIPCGTGSHIKWMLEKHSGINITGLDISEEHIKYANDKITKAGLACNCEFIKGDMNNLKFAENSFDLIWCCDGLWPGPKEMGCPAEEPYDILNNLVRITKNGGKIAILFWSSQKLLPGYPILEAVLNATESANMPVNDETSPELHFMNASLWMQKAGLRNIKTTTFASHIQSPLNHKQKEGLLSLFEMFWANSEKEISKKTWEKYKNLVNPKSEKYILNYKNYSAFLTYTMFIGEVVKNKTS